MSRDIVEDGPKPEAHQVEEVEPVISAQPEKPGLQDTQLKSTFDALPYWKSAWIFRKTALVAALAGFTAVTDGYQFQVTGAIVANAGFKRQFSQGYLDVKGAVAVDPKWISAFNGIFSAGQVIGQFTIPWGNEWIGRKGGVFLVMGVLTLAAIVEAVSKQPWHWMIGKLIAGAGIGAVQATLPVYINEQAPAQIRGFLVVAYSLWWNVGNLLASGVLKARGDSHPLDYRTSIYTQFGMIGLSSIIFVFLPETPWWSVRKGKIDKAAKILNRNFGNVDGYDLERELGVITATVEQQRMWDRETGNQGFWAMFKGLNLKRFLIGSYPKVLQQFVGLAVFSSNAAYFFDLAGNDDPFLVTVILAVVSLVAVVFDAFFVDRLGRRQMVIIGFCGACFGITLIAIIGCLDYESKALGSVLVFGGTFANFFNTFESSTSYAYLTEMSELRFKARATGWGLAYCNLYAVLINFTLPLMLEAWSVRAAFFFVALGIPGTVVAYFIMPESMRRSPAEIEELFTNRVPLRKWKGYKTDVERDMEARIQANV